MLINLCKLVTIVGFMGKLFFPEQMANFLRKRCFSLQILFIVMFSIGLFHAIFNL